MIWLLANNTSVTANLRREASAAGIDAERLEFAPRVDHGRHMARHALADLALDTFPYGAHTTASDAIRVGVPLITRSGRSFQSRVARSVLAAAGLQQLAVDTPEAYEALALLLARDPARLADVRAAVARAASSPLFDAGRFARNLEAGYEAMRERWRSGLAPDTVFVRGQ